MLDVAPLRVLLTGITMTRVLLVTQSAIRSGLRMRLELEPDLSVVGEADDGLGALSLASSLQPDVILIEMESMGVDSPRLIKAIGTTSPKAAVVVLSFRDDPMTREWIEDAGAAAFISKHEDGARLPQVIREAAATQQGPSRLLHGFENARNQ